MTIGSSPFLTADLDETVGVGGHRSPLGLATPDDIVSAKIELIRRRVLAGYYSSPAMAVEVARHLLEPSPRAKR